MNESPGGLTAADAPIPKRSAWRQLWVFVFVIGGVIDLAMVLAFFASDQTGGLAEIAALTSLLAIAGYQIWRADHAGTSAPRTILDRVRRAGVAGAGVLAALLLWTAVRGDLRGSAVVVGLLAVLVAVLVIVVLIQARFDEPYP